MKSKFQNTFKRQFLFMYLVCILTYSFSHTAIATPAQVIIIRHGEKPPIGEILSTKGYERAAALSVYFTNSLVGVGIPEFIYAQSSSGGHSERPIETVKPTANVLGLTINTNYTKDQYPQMVSDILKNPYLNNKIVLICWEHKVITDMTALFGVRPKPGKWHGDVYDRTFVIMFNNDGTIASFKNLPQQLMYGDSQQ